MTKYIRFFLQFSRYYLVILLVLTSVLAYFASHIDYDFSVEALFAADDPVVTEYSRFKAQYGSDDAIVYITFKQPSIFQPEVLKEIHRIADELRRIPHVKSVYSVKDAVDVLEKFLPPEKDSLKRVERIQREVASNPLFSGNVISPDGRTAAIWMEIEGDVVGEIERSKILGRMREILSREEQDVGIKFHTAGIPIIEHEYATLIKRDLFTFLPIVIGAFLLLLACYFRNVMGTLLPLACMSVAILWLLGLMNIFGLHISALTSIVPNMIMVIGIADCVHMLSRYQEELVVTHDKREAIARMLVVMLFACFLTSFTTAVGFFSQVTSNLHVIREFGWVSALGFVLGYIATIQLAPSALDVAPPLKGRIADQYVTLVSDHSMKWLARLIERRKALLAGGWIILLAISVYGMFRIRVNSSWLQDMRTESPVTQAHQFIERNLSSVFSMELEVHGKTPGALKDPDLVRKVEAFQREIRLLPNVTTVLSAVDFLKEAARVRAMEENPMLFVMAKPETLRVLPKDRERLEECVAFYEKLAGGRNDMLTRMVTPDYASARISVRVKEINTRSLQQLMEAVRAKHRERYAADFGLGITGKSAMAKSALDKTMNNMLASLGLSAVIMLICFSILYRSFPVGLLSMVPNMTPIIVTMGFMGIVGIDLNFSTVMIFSVALGIAVDNTIHYLTRYRLEIAVDGDPTQAMVRTLKGAGRPMIFSTVLLLVGFGSLLTSNFVFTFNFGILGGVALFAALLSDLTLMPGLMHFFRPRVTRWEKVEERLKKVSQMVDQMLAKKGISME